MRRSHTITATSAYAIKAEGPGVRLYRNRTKIGTPESPSLVFWVGTCEVGDLIEAEGEDSSVSLTVFPTGGGR